MWTAEYLCAHLLSEHFHQARWLTWSSWHPSCGQGSAPGALGRPLPRPLVFPSAVAHAPPIPAPNPGSQAPCWSLFPAPQDVCFPKPSQAAHPEEEARQVPAGRAPTAQCETSGYNTGPGRCSYPRVLCCSRRDAGPQQSLQRRRGLDAARRAETGQP